MNDYVGKKVKLKFFPYCVGIISDFQPALVVGVQLTSNKYKIVWDNAEYGISDWLSEDSFDFIF